MTDSPERIGPYRVMRRLGAGGMGEVFLAHDDRLARQVALKRMRPDKRDRARFHREARIAAQLNHPGVVQVYDVIRDGDADYIVMEYVPGTTLRQRLADGPLDVADVIALATHIAEAMAEAHEHGVIHRDLKSENVLLTRAGRPKIGDFGVARQIASGDESITGPGAVVGTYRAMSPEQASGKPVDKRSDLFSFGVLLYELVTGVSPFQGDNPLAVLQRIVHDDPTPAHQLSAAVPVELSRLIEHLLQKPPSLRPCGFRDVVRDLAELGPPPDADELSTVVPASTGSSGDRSPVSEQSSSSAPAGERLDDPDRADRRATGRDRSVTWKRVALIALTPALLGAVGYFTLRGQPSRPAPAALRYVAVLPPEAEPSVTDAALMTTGLRTMLLQGLGDIESLVVLAPADVDRAPRSALSELARTVAADELITSSLVCATSVCTVSIDRIHGRDGRLLWTGSFEVPGHRFRAWAESVAIHIRRAYVDEPVRTAASAPPVSPDDYRAYMRLRRAYNNKDPTRSSASIREQLGKIRERAPGFVAAYVFEAQIALVQFHTSRDQRDIDDALQLADAARKLAPLSTEPLTVWFSATLAANRLDEADAALDQLHALSPGNAWIAHWRGQVLERRGERTRAIAHMREAASVHPSWRILFDLANAEFHHGQLDEARGRLEAVLDRIPDHYDSQSLLAQIELESGRLDRAEALYRALVDRAPGVAEFSNLGTVLLLAGRYNEAAETLSEAHALAADNPLVMFNLADAELLAGNTKQARNLYQQVIALIDDQPGFADWWPHLIARAQALAHLERYTQAIESIQRALRKEPENGQVCYAAAVVYALAGESSSALINAVDALKRGFAPGWFAFPWFDELRQHPTFIEQARQTSKSIAR